MRAIYADFSPEDAAAVKAYERTTNHDVKAVEYFVKSRLQEIDSLAEHVEFVHFACTSEDINNLAYGLMLLESLQEVVLPQTSAVIEAIAALSADTIELPMLSRTHGQPASPTTLGKELRNVCERLRRQQEQIEQYHTIGDRLNCPPVG